MTETAYFSAIAGNQKIDAEAGIISGVSVITEGEARGHNLWIDQTTLSQVQSVASKFNGGIKVKLSQVKDHDGSVSAIVGNLKNFRVEGSNVRADLHLLKTSPSFGQIVELSEKMPNEFGFSIVFPKHSQKVDGKDCCRVIDIYSADLVEAPAANPTGLFSQPEPKNTFMTIDTKLTAVALGLPETATEQEVQAAFLTKLSAKAPVTDLTALTSKIEEAQTKLTALTTEAETAKLSARKTEIAALVAEAARDGKVVPLSDEQLLKLSAEEVKGMITKLSKTVQTARREIKLPVNKDGGRLQGEELVSFCRQKQEEGAMALTQKFNSMGLN